MTLSIELNGEISRCPCLFFYQINDNPLLIVNWLVVLDITN